MISVYNKFDTHFLCVVNYYMFAVEILISWHQHKQIDRSRDRWKKYQQNSQNYLIPDKTTKSD